MRVLVTGHRGYIGSVTAVVLRNAGCDVVGLDVDLNKGCEFGRVHESFPCFDLDLRDVDFADLLSFDAVVHLAALSDDDSGAIDPGLTASVNHHGAVRFAELCKQAQVSRFVFASSCSVYGRTCSEVADEQSPVQPLTHYAHSKLAAEREIAAFADGAFCPTSLRIGTVYGVSPRIRLDTVVNEFAGSAVALGRIVMRTSGTAWRPFVHVEDVARVILGVLSAPEDAVRGENFNVVPHGGNHRIIDVADSIAECVPHCSRRLPLDVSDRSDYRVDGSKWLEAMPKFTYHWTLRQGLVQLISALRNSGLTPAEWRGCRFRRAHWLRSQMDSGALEADLKTLKSAVA